jgi:hypothetical protein
MNDVVTLNSLAALAIEHEADFEVFHGKTTHADKRVRAQMILSLEGCPDVRVAFGDKKHGQRINSITLAGNDKINVKQEQLLEALESNTATSQWQRVMDRDSTVININPSGDNKISLTGKIVGLPKLVEDETGFYQWHEYEVLIENHVLNTVTQKVQEAEPTRFFARIPIARGSAPNFADGTTLGMTGDYVFPHRIDVRSLTRKA